ncbi:uncharacterized protein LOC123678409 [Harmonia axyridis]|uniref:uncharacterized protein LOC123678409 n=1 Tax=Harmonia axyridis TaxID=115357 RepID=UPI001E274F8B|nr:uncharacterized protein LOC123678409 [Harmonia axyridis]
MSFNNQSSDMIPIQVEYAEYKRKKEYLKRIVRLTTSKMQDDESDVESGSMSYKIPYKIYIEALEQLLGKEVVERKIKDKEEREKREKEEKKIEERTWTEKLAIFKAMNRASCYKQLLDQVIIGQESIKDANLLMANLCSQDKQRNTHRHLEFTPTVPKRAL